MIPRRHHPFHPKTPQSPNTSTNDLLDKAHTVLRPRISKVPKVFEGTEIACMKHTAFPSPEMSPELNGRHLLKTFQSSARLVTQPIVNLGYQ